MWVVGVMIVLVVLVVGLVPAIVGWIFSYMNIEDE